MCIKLLSLIDTSHLKNSDYFHQDPCIIPIIHYKIMITSDLTMFKKVRKKMWICPFTGIYTES